MNPENATQTTQFGPSEQAGFFYSFQLDKKSSLSFELLASQIEGKETFKTNYDYTQWGGNKNDQMTFISYRHISYLSLPVFYGLRFKKLIINAGFQTSYSFSSSERYKSVITLDETIHTVDEKSDDINIKKIDFGPKAELIYNLNERLAIEGSYYYGIHNIQKGDAPIWTLKIQQASLGIRYTLWANQ